MDEKQTQDVHAVEKVRGAASSTAEWGLDKSKGTMQDAQRATGDVLTKAKDVAGEVISKAATAAGDLIEQNLGKDARKYATAVVEDLGEQAHDITRRARDQAAATAENMYQQGSRAGAYLSQNVEANPLTALLIAGAVGFGIAYLLYRR